MSVLKDKTYPQYTQMSRYNKDPIYYHSKDDKYVTGMTSNLYKTTAHLIHNVKPTDNLDKLALMYYNDPTLYWVIALFNDIEDVFINLSDYYQTVKIPQITGIKFGLER